MGMSKGNSEMREEEMAIGQNLDGSKNTGI